MNILAIGDVVGKQGCNFLEKKLPNIKKLHNIDLVIANGENSANGNGINRLSADMLFNVGVNVITTGNHAFRQYNSLSIFDEYEFLIRPANHYKQAVGKGWCEVDFGKFSVCIINMQGIVYLSNLRNPFYLIDEILSKVTSKIIVVDFHGEATAEKIAFANYIDGRVSLVFGTHTHVQTADERLLPKGTAYISDIGMTGVIDSVIGVKKEISIAYMKEQLPIKFDYAVGNCKLDGIVCSIDTDTGKPVSIERISIT